MNPETQTTTNIDGKVVEQPADIIDSVPWKTPEENANTRTAAELRDAALQSTVVIENPSPETMANAIGSPYERDALGRVVPKQ